MHGQLAAQLEQQKAADTAQQAQLEWLLTTRMAGAVPPGVAGGPGGVGAGDEGLAAGEDAMS